MMHNVLNNISKEQLESIRHHPMGNIRRDFKELERQFERDMRPISRRFFDSCLELIERKRTKTKEESIEKIEKEEKKRKKPIKIPQFGRKEKQPSIKTRLKWLKDALKEQKNILKEQQGLKPLKHWEHFNRISRRGRLKGVSGDVASFLKFLPKANWQGKFGGMPTTPGYPTVPTFCPKSIMTNLKRVFFSGINILDELNKVKGQYSPEQIQFGLKSVGQKWNDWLNQVKQRHARTSSDIKVIEALKDIIEYLFNQAGLDEFIEDFGKLAFTATNPQDLYNKIARNFGGIRGGSLSR